MRRRNKNLILHVHSFEDGLTRRSAKLAQAVQPPLASRGAQSECRALDVAQSRHGRKCASAEFLRPRATFSEFCSPLDYVSARIKFFQKYEKSVTHDRRIVPYSEWGRKARMGLPAKCTFCGVPGRRGCNTPKFEDVQPVLPEFHHHAGKDVAQHSRVKGREVCLTLIYILFMSGIFLRARHNCAGRTHALC